MNKRVTLLIYFLLLTNLITARAETQNWTLLETRSFDILGTFERTQGLASDHQGEFWYSSNWGIIRTHGAFGGLEAGLPSAIPIELKLMGDNHIGDIDIADGRIYAPIEDGPKYKSPHIGVFDAKTLNFISYFSLSAKDQPDGVPWVAVQIESRLAYSSTYENCTLINVYDLDHFQLLRKLKLSQVIHSVQGAKVYQNQMFLTSNGDKSIYQVDLSSGETKKLFSIPTDIHEIEGLALEGQGSTFKIYVLGLRRHGGVLSTRSEVLVYGTEMKASGL